MASKPPPPRYRIVERDARLITIDTWDTRATPMPPQPTVPSASGRDAGFAWRLLVGVTRPAPDGRRILTTNSLYDIKAPRPITLDDTAARNIGRAIVAAIVILAATLAVTALIDPGSVVAALIVAAMLGWSTRPTITRRLDAIERRTAVD